MKQALSDVKIVDLTQVLAGPFATTILSDFGADIIKVEPPGGDYTWKLVSSRPIQVQKLSAWCKRRNRKSVTLNLTSDKGKEIFLKLVEKADVVVQNFRQPVMDKLGLGYNVLKKANPQVIYCALSGYGQTGPYKERMAYDPTIQAIAGIMSLNGYADKPPVRVGMQLADYCGAVYTVIGILMALHYRKVSGEGQMIDASMFDAMCHWSMGEVGGFLMAGGKRLGNKHPWAVPMDAFLTKDNRYLMFGVQTDAQWRKFLKMVGREDLSGWTFNDRLNNRDTIEPIAEQWALTKSADEAQELLEKADLPYAKITDILELPEDPQVLIRELVLEVDDPDCGRLPGVIGTVPKLLGTPGSIRGVPPFPGQHNEEILCDMLGYTRDNINNLKSQGIV
jgi:crotonobetainyl-CoA:carnitine CoA-transferase CaiB-like acyl-CoA transferase